MKNIKPRGVILVLTLALVVFLSGLLGVLLINASFLSKHIRDNLELTVFYDVDLDDGSAKSLSDSIANLAYVRNVSFVSSEDAIFNFKEEIGEDFVEILGNNPLPASTILTVKSNFTSETSLAEINSKLRQISGVLEVSYPQNVFHQIDRNSRLISFWITALGLIFILVATVLIASTVRLLLHSDRFLIKNQQLVGATESFVKKPYRVRGLLWSITSFFIGVILLVGLLWFVFIRLNMSIDLNMAAIAKHFGQNWIQYVLMLFLLLLVTSVVVITTINVTVKKYLNTSTDFLYK